MSDHNTAYFVAVKEDTFNALVGMTDKGVRTKNITTRHKRLVLQLFFDKALRAEASYGHRDSEVDYHVDREFFNG